MKAYLFCCGLTASRGSSMFFYENAFVLDCFSIYFDVVGDGWGVKGVVLIL